MLRENLSAKSKSNLMTHYMVTNTRFLSRMRRLLLSVATLCYLCHPYLAECISLLEDDIPIGNGWWPTMTFNQNNDLFLVLCKKYGNPDGYGDLRGR